MQSISLIEREDWNSIDLSRLKKNTELVNQLKQINTLNDRQKLAPVLLECLAVLNNFEDGGEVDPAQAKLRQEMNTAAADLDFDKAKALKEELEQLEQNQSDEANIGWWIQFVIVDGHETVTDIEIGWGLASPSTPATVHERRE